MFALSSFKSSISFALARMVLVSSCLFGVFISLLFLIFNFYHTQQSFEQIRDEIASVTEGSAAYAAWTLDEQFADQVASSVMSHSYVDYFELKDDVGSVLALREINPQKSHYVTRWIARQFDQNVLYHMQPLIMPYDQQERVGTLTIRLSARAAAEEIIYSSFLVLIFGIVQAFVVACIFLWISLKKITLPIRMYANFIDNVDPNNPASQRIEPKPYQKDNEIGRVVDKTNELLDELSESQSKLRRFASTDTLTLLPNRNFIVKTLNDAIEEAKRSAHSVAVLFIDLNRFKNINDSLGHEFGDKLLVDVAKRLGRSVCKKSNIGRLGGDEFLVVINNVKQQSDILYNLNRIEKAFEEPFDVDGKMLRTGCSIGVSIYPEHGDDSNVLMRCADLAMYEIKPKPQTWHFYTHAMTTAIDAKMKTESALHASLENNNFILYYQPKMAALTDRLAGCEALIRWKKGPEAITAAEFIDVAEESGMIIELGYWVLEEACRQGFVWQQKFGGVPISVNISAKQLQEADFIEKSLSIIERHGVSPSLLEFEITETIMMSDLDKTIGMLTQLRKAGIKISIDDFGTGYSSLAYLTRLPVDALKLDREFVSGAKQSKDVLNMILSMAQSLNLITVAEGVETQEQQNWLIDNRCDYLQGYFFSKPIPAEEFERAFLIDYPSLAS